MDGPHSLEARARVGLGWRPELAGDLLSYPDAIDFVEITAEACCTKEALREGRAVAEAWPTVVHGVKTSLGSAEGIDMRRARNLARVARELRASCVSEHVAFVRAGGVEIGHLTGLPFTHDVVSVVARNVAEARRLLPDVPLLLENVAWSFRWPDDSMHEGDFYAEIASRTGCDLLLDVGNLYANAVNAGCDPSEYAERHPLERVGMIHVAGGVFEDGFYFDTHADPIPDAVFDLVGRVLAVTGDVPIVLERDAAFPPFSETHAELSRLAKNALRPRGPRAPHPRPPTRSFERAPPPGMALAQHALALALTSSQSPADADFTRARAILRRKRADDALRLLPRLAALGDDARGLALRSIDSSPRSPSRVAVHDAFVIAQAAEDDATLRDLACTDAMALRARFVTHGEHVEPRVAPFVGRLSSPRGVIRWVLKGLGAKAPVRILEGTGGT